jgi:hypothetical protein
MMRSLRKNLQDPNRRFLIMAMIVLGIVLVITSRQQPPVIQALEVTSEQHGHCYLIQDNTLEYRVGREQVYDIECTVSNTRATLTYDWTYEGGELEGEGPLVTWTAPNSSSDVTVKVTVSDSAGNTVSDSVLLRVVRCSACTFRGCP